ncbi:MAG: site-2 protease family protein [Clostridia bacterium]|nr:site-2 protease family protein [Clostridia bacterium]
MALISYIDEFFRNPKGMLIFFLLAFPGRILALSLHEFAHAWMADRCGDPTARMLGRMTVNPLKHLDPLGTLLMLLVGFGWAKPVPVNPRNYRDPRRDDLKVSLAGVTMNLILFVLSMVLMTAAVALALARVPAGDLTTTGVKVFRMNYMGSEALIFPADNTYVPLMQLLLNLPYYPADTLIAPVFGSVASHLYQMLGYFCVTNLVLCVFNLLPVPPLDGYHVFNDLLLRRRQLFADPRTARIASTVLFVLVITGVLGRALGWVDAQIITGAGRLAAGALKALGLMGA